MWVLEDSGTRRVWLDSLAIVTAPTTLEGMLAAERAQRQRVPPALRGRFSGSVPPPFDASAEQTIDFGEALELELDAIERVDESSDDARVYHAIGQMAGSTATYWLVRAHWAAQTGHPKLVGRALDQVERWATCESDPDRFPIHRDCNPEQAIRLGLQRILLRESKAAIRSRRPWATARDFAQRAYAINPTGPLAKDASELLERINRLDAMLNRQPDRPGQPRPPRTARQQTEALIALLPEQIETHWKHPFSNGRFAKSPLEELLVLGRAAVPTLLEHLHDDRPTRRGPTVGEVILDLLEFFAERLLFRHADEPLVQRQQRVRKWWADGGPGLVDWVADPQPSPAPELPPDWGQNLVMPAFADFTFDPKKLSTQTTVRRPGHLFAAATGTRWPARARKRLESEDVEPATYPVLNSGEGRQLSRRVQLLCTHPAHRVWIWRAGKVLQRTARLDSVLLPRRQVEGPPTAKTPGLRVRAGVPLKIRQSSGTKTLAAYRDDSISARGWIESELVDIVWGATAPKGDVTPSHVSSQDHKLLGDVVSVRDRPRGSVFARIDNEFQQEVRILERQVGAVLVEAEFDEVTIVGWVDAANVSAARLHSASLIGKPGTRARYWNLSDPWTLVLRGSLLVDEYSEQVVGVTTWDTTFACDGPCVETPRVWVEACGYELAVRVVRPKR